MDTYDLRSVCHKWGKSDRWFRRHKDHLERGGFPKPLNIPNSKLLWRKADVDAYFRDADMTPSERNAIASRRALDEKYGGRG